MKIEPNRMPAAPTKIDATFASPPISCIILCISLMSCSFQSSSDVEPNLIISELDQKFSEAFFKDAGTDSELVSATFFRAIVSGGRIAMYQCDSRAQLDSLELCMSEVSGDIVYQTMFPELSVWAIRQKAAWKIRNNIAPYDSANDLVGYGQIRQNGEIWYSVYREETLSSFSIAWNFKKDTTNSDIRYY